MVKHLTISIPGLPTPPYSVLVENGDSITITKMVVSSRDTFLTLPRVSFFEADGVTRIFDANFSTSIFAAEKFNSIEISQPFLAPRGLLVQFVNDITVKVTIYYTNSGS